MTNAFWWLPPLVEPVITIGELGANEAVGVTHRVAMVTSAAREPVNNATELLSAVDDAPPPSWLLMAPAKND